MIRCCGLKEFTLVAAVLALTTPCRGGPEDETIADWVVKALRNDPRVLPAEIEVTVQDGVVTLTGSVRSLAERNYAAVIAAKIQGVRDVINRVNVLPVPRADEDIADDVGQRISHSSPLRRQPIEVVVAGGIVTLRGSVRSYGQRAEAELLAGEVRGVKAVRNELQFEYAVDRPDGEIKEDILAAIDRDVYLTGLRIKVEVRNGVVILEGIVGNAYQKERAEKEAWSTPNVTDVSNNLQVNWLEDRGLRATPPNLTDDELRDRVSAELKNDPRINETGITVSATRGRVTLGGTVPSLYQRQIAELDARSVAGAVGITNLLTVRTELRADRELREDVLAEVATDYLLRDNPIDVQVGGGVVTLRGEVDGHFVKVHASYVVGRVQGVLLVQNHLKVTSPPQTPDAVLVERIKTRLEANWETRWVADQIQVQVKTGRAILSGDLDHFAQRQEAARVAFLTDGVQVVENRMTVVGIPYAWEEWFPDGRVEFLPNPVPDSRHYFDEPILR
jgi:osmotically-inducible protein OsmY